MATKVFSVFDLLDVAQACSNTLVAIGIEGIEADGYSCIDARVNFTSFQDRLYMCVYDFRCCNRVCIDEIAVLVSFIFTFFIAITEWELQ